LKDAVLEPDILKMAFTISPWASGKALVHDVSRERIFDCDKVFIEARFFISIVEFKTPIRPSASCASSIEFCPA
jgi:hypothetical protein